MIAEIGVGELENRAWGNGECFEIEHDASDIQPTIPNGHPPVTILNHLRHPSERWGIIEARAAHTTGIPQLSLG